MRVMKRRQAGPVALGVLVLVFALIAAACGGSSTTTTSAPPTTAAPTTTPTTATPSITPSTGTTGISAAATTTTVTFTGEEAKIAEVWTKFFDGKGPVKDKIAMLENGDTYAKQLDTNAASPMAAQSSAQVTSIKLTSDTGATVTYTILLNGQPALPNVTGEAVKQDGQWKVSAKSFLSLLALQGVSVPST